MELRISGSRAALADDLGTELGWGENLVWLGGPDPRATFRKMRPLLWIGVPLTATAGIATAIHSTGIVDCIVGVALTAGPFVNVWLASNTVYALTQRRALILCKPFGSSTFVAVDLGRAAKQPEILRSQGGIGTVLFATGLPTRRRYTDYAGNFGFWDVPDPDELADVLRSITGSRP